MKEQSAVSKYFYWLLFFSCAWWIVLIPLDYNLVDFLLRPVQSLAKDTAGIFSNTDKFTSDGSGMYVLLLLSFVLAVISAFIALKVRKINKQSPQSLNHFLITFFVALILLKYGWIKVMKLQFYLPEPNIVYSRFGSLSKDIAYWSLIGTSRFYSVSTGLIEVFTGVLLIFRRTRLVGFILATGIFANVLLINLSFDISVKLFSATMLVFSAIGLWFYRNKLRILTGLPIKLNEDLRISNIDKFQFLKALIVTVLIIEAVYPSVISGSLNDDNVPRPPHHGAYQLLNSVKYDKLYIHRDHYLILEEKSGNQKDYKLDLKTVDSFTITDQRTGNTGKLVFKGSKVLITLGSADTIEFRKIPYKQLPLMRETIHVFSDSFH